MNPLKRYSEAPEPKAKSALSWQDVWKAPADYNRATRRWARLWGRIWAWDAKALGLPSDLPPRYVRRHFDSDKFMFPKTRRQRRERARIVRAMKQRGMKV